MLARLTMLGTLRYCEVFRVSKKSLLLLATFTSGPTKLVDNPPCVTFDLVRGIPRCDTCDPRIVA